ncbi:MAG: hypothetical protein AAFN59_05625 [Pseudomonadota bacterium]
MPLERLVLILVIVVAAAGATVWIAYSVAGAFALGPAGAFIMIPLALVIYVAWRIISDRVSSREDNHYDRIEK